MTEEEFWAALAPLPKSLTTTYRLYYNKQGEPLFYSQEDCSGNYIEVDQLTYQNPPAHVRVVDQKLVVLTTTSVSKLKPNGQGTACHCQDVSIVVDSEEPHTKWSLA